MPKKPNYGFQKNLKEQKRAKKQEAKRQRKAEAQQREREAAAPPPDVPPDALDAKPA